MKKIEIKTYEMGESLFTTLIFLVFGIFLVTDPVDMVKMAMYILGGLITIVGIFNLLIYYKTAENKKEIINGGVFIVVGMATILCVALFYDMVETFLRYLLALYLLYVGINRIVSAFKAKGNKAPYYVNAIVIIIIAILLAVIPGLPLYILGWFIVAYAVVDIIGFILGRKNVMEVNEVKEAVIVNEKIETKESEDTKLLK